MDNKQSELSKPIQIFKHPSGRNFWSVSADSNAGTRDVEPYYSQEYVSALLERVEAAERQSHERYVRIAELESKLVNAAHYIAELEQKLATPVRLPDIRSDDYHETGWFQHMKYYRDVERLLRAAGFTVGDE